jgi:hypothetical protein
MLRCFYKLRAGGSRFELTQHLVQVAGVSGLAGSSLTPCEVQLWACPELDRRRCRSMPCRSLPLPFVFCDPTIVRCYSYCKWENREFARLVATSRGDDNEQVSVLCRVSFFTIRRLASVPPTSGSLLIHAVYHRRGEAGVLHDCVPSPPAKPIYLAFHLADHEYYIPGRAR